MQQHDAVSDLACCVALGRAERHVMHAQLGDRLTVSKMEIFDDVIGFLLVRPVGLGERRRCGGTKEGGDQRMKFHDLLQLFMSVRTACLSKRPCNRTDFSHCWNIGPAWFRKACRAYSHARRLRSRHSPYPCWRTYRR